MKDVKQGLSKFMEGTSKSIRYLRETLQQLKEQAKKERMESEQVVEAPKRQKRQEVEIHFSMVNVAKATILVLVLIALTNFLGEISRIVLIFIISIFFSAALTPTVRNLERRKIPRSVSVIGMFLILILILGFFISQLIPLVATQLLELAKSFTSLIIKLTSDGDSLPLPESFRVALEDLLESVDRETIIAQLKTSLEGLSSQLEGFAGDTFGVIKAVFNGILNFFLVLILTFFMVVNERDMHEFFVSLFPSKHGKYIAEKIHTIQEKIGYWLRGQIILMFLMFGLSLIGLLILGIDNALTLAMMTGIAELLPVVGPIAAGIPAVLVAFNESPWLAVWMIGLIVLLQQIEGNILVPLVMRRAVGLSPIVIIPAMLIGLETLGVVGMILAIPTATAISIFVREYAEKEK